MKSRREQPLDICRLIIPTSSQEALLGNSCMLQQYGESGFIEVKVKVKDPRISRLSRDVKETFMQYTQKYSYLSDRDVPYSSFFKQLTASQHVQ